MTHTRILLLIKGLFEVAFATSMKPSQGFSRFRPSVAVTAISSLAFPNLALKGIPLGTAYAVRTGIGEVATIIIGFLLVRNPVTLCRLLFPTLIVAGLVGLRLAAGEE